jgi:hypothetical protein
MSKQKSPPFVMVTKEVLDAPAWRAMSHGARSLYVSLKRRYSHNFKNNGRIYLSQRAARKEMGSGSSQIVRWFRELQYYGFIAMTEPGCLGVNGKGRAPHWRLTEVAYMRGTSSKGSEDMPTRDFLRWNGVRFSRRQIGGEDKKKTESRSRKLEHTAPENWSTYAPENWSTNGNNRSRKLEHTDAPTAPENWSISMKPSGVGGRALSEGEADTVQSLPASRASRATNGSKQLWRTPHVDELPRACVYCGGTGETYKVANGRRSIWLHLRCTPLWARQADVAAADEPVAADLPNPWDEVS